MNFDKLVNEINKSFDEKRITESKHRLGKIWNLEIPEDRIPFVFSKIEDGSDVDEEKLYETDYDIEDFLYYQLYQICKRSVINDDYIPSFFPGLRPSIMPSAFGAIEEKKEGHYWAKPIIKKPEDVYRLEEPDFNIKGTSSWKVLENIKYCRKMTKGNIPIHISDAQSPMACGSVMWDVNDYLVALYENPDEVHYLHKILTKAFMSFVDLQIEAAEGDFISMTTPHFCWMPPGKGIGICNDTMVMVSPKLLTEFSIPFDNQIADQYNGVLIHSCGNYKHNLEALKTMNNLIALNFGATETDINAIIEVFGNSITYIPHSLNVGVYPLTAESQEDFIKRISKIIKDNNLSACVPIFSGPSDYSYKQALELNELALREFSLK